MTRGLCDSFTLERLQTLRDADLPDTLDNNTRIARGIYISWDGEGTGADVSVSRNDDEILAIAGSFQATPRWFTVNFELGTGPFEAGDIIGMVVEAQSQGDAALSVLLRSHVNGHSIDVEAQGPLHLGGDPRIATAFLQIDTAFQADSFHTVMVKLPKSGMRVAFRDLRVFHVPAKRGLRAGPHTMSSFAV